MRSSLLLLALSFATPAFATTPVAAVDPNVLLTLTVVTGMPVARGLTYRRITVQRDGFVRAEEERARPFGHREFVFAAVPARDLAQIEHVIATLSGRPLVREDHPECPDGPGFDYEMNKGGVLVEFHQRHNCVDARPVSQTERPLALAMKTLLDQLNQMADAYAVR